MKKFIFVLTLLIGGIMGMNAQSVETNTRFFDNWSVGIKSGVTTPLKNVPFFKGMRNISGVELRRELTVVNGIGVEGNWMVNTTPSENVFDTQYVGAYMTTNFSNLFGGYKGSPRVFEVETVLGAGWIHQYVANAKDDNSWYTKAGLNLNFNLGKAKIWTLALKPAVVFDMTDNLGKTNFNRNRAYLEVLAGITYHFKNSNGTHHFVLSDKVATQKELDLLNEEINRLRASQSTPVTVVETVTNNVEVIVDKTELLNAVGFTINSSKVSDTEYANLESLARWLNKNSDIKVLVKGYADRETGSAEYNAQLAERRANAVKDILVNVFNVNADQLTVVSEGSANGQPFTQNNWNRVVIFSVND